MFAVIQLGDFGLQAVMRLEASLAREAAVALLDGEAKKNSRIAACTPAARAAGVEPGQSVPLAMARCARLIIRAPSPAAEREAAASLLAAAFSLSPAVEATAPGICTAQLAGLAPARRAPALRLALERLAAAGLQGTGGLGATPLLALYDALHAGFHSTLPLAVAAPTPEQADILAAWGIRTLGEFAALPKADIAQRLGPGGLALWERCAGEASRPLHLTAPPRTFSALIECEDALETLEPVLFLLRRLVDRLAQELANASLSARELTLTLPLADETAHVHRIRLPEPTHRPDILFRALHTHLETIRTAAPVIGVGLHADPAPILGRQEGLFDCALRDPHAFTETLARISALVGEGRVGAPEPENTHRPDAVRLAPPRSVIAPPAPGHRPPLHGLSLRRRRPPLPATVELVGRRPAFVWTESVRGRVRDLAGPWYCSGGWWQPGQDWEREEWDIELESGGLYRIIRTPAGWFLEGEYD